MPFTAWKNKERNRQKNVFTMTSGGFVIVVRNNSLNYSKWHSLEPTYNYFKDLNSLVNPFTIP